MRISDSKRAYLFGFFAIFGWSTSATFGGLLTGEATSFEIVLSIQFIAIVSIGLINLSWFNRTNLSNLIITFAKNRKILLAFSCFSIFLCIYQLLFYFALLSSVRIYANIANYLWPILLYFLLLLPLFNRLERFRFLDLLLLVLAFFGVLSLVIEVEIFTHLEQNNTAYFGIGAGILAAFCAAIYMASSSFVIRECKRENFILPSPLLYLMAMLPTCLIMGVIVYISGEKLPLLNDRTILVYLWLGIVTVAIAQSSWTEAISLGEGGKIAVLAYLVPLFSTGLQILVFGDQITPTLLFGIVFIIVASVLTAHIFKQIMAETAALVAFMYVGFAAFFNINTFLKIDFEAVDILSLQIFGLLIAFALNRQAQSLQSQKEKLFLWKAKLSTLLREFKSSTNHELLGKRAFELLRSIIEIDQASDKAKQIAKYSEYLAAENRLIVAAENLHNGTTAELHSNIEDLQATSSELLSVGTERIGSGEITIICVLGLASCIFYTAISFDSLSRTIISMLVVASIAYLIFKVIKQNVQPAIYTTNDLEALQNIPILNSFPLYLGEIYKLQIGPDIQKLERRVEILTEDQEYRVIHTSQSNNYIDILLYKRKLGILTILLGAACTVILLFVNT